MQHLSPLIQETSFFSLDMSYQQDTSCIDMQIFSPIFHTIFLPQTYPILKQYLPSIYFSTCVNDKNLSFAKEVKNTEIGHLFEHILLEYIYSIKKSLGYKNIFISGETSWDWMKTPKGFFTITINIGIGEKEILLKALAPAISLLEYIFSFSNESKGMNTSDMSFSQPTSLLLS